VIICNETPEGYWNADETHVHDGILFFLRFYRSIVSVSTLQELTFHQISLGVFLKVYSSWCKFFRAWSRSPAEIRVKGKGKVNRCIIKEE